MKKVFQLTDDLGRPLGGRVFIAPDEASMATSLEEAQSPGVTFTEVESEEALIVPDTAEVPLDLP